MSFILTLLLVGFFYWLFISSNKGNFTHSKKNLPFEEVLYSEFGYIIALVAKLAKSDGHISDLEAELVENLLDDLCEEFSDPVQARHHLKLIFKEEKEIQDNITFVAGELYNKIPNEAYKHQKIIEFMITLAFIDGSLHPKEKEIIIESAKALHLEATLIETIFSQFSEFYEERSTHGNQNSEESYYKLLEITKSYDAKTLKKAYKKGVKEYHPDVVMGKGGSKEDINKATKKLQEINEAYEYLKKKKSF